MSRLDELLRQAREAEPDDLHPAEVERAISHAAVAGRARHRSWALRRVTTVAGVSAALAAAAAVLWMLGPSASPTNPEPTVAEPSTSRAVVDDESPSPEAASDDAAPSVLELDTGDHLLATREARYTVQRATRRERRVQLGAGSMLFDVRPIEGSSFTVVTADARVVVLGTVFTVQADAGGTTVRVYEGRVQVEHEGQIRLVERGGSTRVGDGRAAHDVDPLREAAREAAAARLTAAEHATAAPPSIPTRPAQSQRRPRRAGAAGRRSLGRRGARAARLARSPGRERRPRARPGAHGRGRPRPLVDARGGCSARAATPSRGGACLRPRIRSAALASPRAGRISRRTPARGAHAVGCARPARRRRRDRSRLPPCGSVGWRSESSSSPASVATAHETSRPANTSRSTRMEAAHPRCARRSGTKPPFRIRSNHDRLRSRYSSRAWPTVPATRARSALTPRARSRSPRWCPSTRTSPPARSPSRSSPRWRRARRRRHAWTGPTAAAASSTQRDDAAWSRAALVTAAQARGARGRGAGGRSDLHRRARPVVSDTHPNRSAPPATPKDKRSVPPPARMPSKKPRPASPPTRLRVGTDRGEHLVHAPAAPAGTARGDRAHGDRAGGDPHDGRRDRHAAARPSTSFAPSARHSSRRPPSPRARRSSTTSSGASSKFSSTTPRRRPSTTRPRSASATITQQRCAALGACSPSSGATEPCPRCSTPRSPSRAIPRTARGCSTPRRA